MAMCFIQFCVSFSLQLWLHTNVLFKVYERCVMLVRLLSSISTGSVRSVASEFAWIAINSE